MVNETDEKGRVPYKERVVLVGRGKLRDGEHHAVHPQVMGLVLTSADPKDAPGTVEFWLRASDEQCDAQGHTHFIPIEEVRVVGQLNPRAKGAVNWKAMQR